MTTCPKCHYARQPGDSESESECPKCGVIYEKAKPARPPKRPAEIMMARRKAEEEASRFQTDLWKAGFVILGLGLFVYSSISMRGTPVAPSATPSVPMETVFNSAYDGSVIQVERYLKRTLKDPGSFQAIQWYPVQKDLEGFTVRVRYRAKNSFGALVIEDGVFLLDRQGRVQP